ncbi:MAG: Gfo/Idh/MocA family protein [Limisphaerales bacterium]
MNQIGVAIVGCGGVTLQNHLPGLALCPQVRIAALCDTDPAVLQKAAERSGVTTAATRYEEVLKRDDVQAVIIATPNVTHAPIALAAIAAGKHVLCEKPIAMDHAEARRMGEAADRAGVRHMTAFTYRFVPAMRYLVHLVNRGDLGQPYHFRACRLQDWGQRALGWRQVAKLAGTGELGDMLSHRIDYAHMLMGPINRLTAAIRRFHEVRDGQVSDLEDWVAILSEFGAGATGVWESSKVATGRGEGGHSQDCVEVNGSEASAVFQLERPHELQITRCNGAKGPPVSVPPEFLKWPGSPRNPAQGDPLLNFRYDQDFEFIDAILGGRPCVPSLAEGARVQAVMDAAVTSARNQRWAKVQY